MVEDEDYEEPQSTEEDEELVDSEEERDDEGGDGDDDDDEDNEEEEESSSEVQEIRKNPRRSTRKVKITKAEFSDEEDADKSFWNQDFWKDDGDQGKSEKNEFEDPGTSSSEDFSEVDETQIEPEVEEKEVKEKKPKKRNNVYKDPRLMKKRPQMASKKRKREVAPVVASRASTRAATQQKSAILHQKMELEREEQAYRSRLPKRKRRKKAKMTQAERLREAKRTEIENAKSLANMMRIEDARKNTVKKEKKINGPMIRSYTGPASKSKGVEVLSFHNCRPKDTLFKSWQSAPEHRDAYCVITRQRAYYFDPVTKQPYYDLSSFKALRKSRKVKTKPIVGTNQLAK